MTKSTSGRTIWFYWREVKKEWKLALPLAICLPLAVIFNSYVGPYVIAQVINILTQQTIPSDQVWSTFWPYVAIYIGASILGALVFWRLVNYLSWKMETKIVYELNRKSFPVLAEQSMHFHNNRFGGSLVSQVNKFSGSYGRLKDTFVYNLAPTILSIIIVIGVLAPQMPFFALAMLLLAVAYISFTWFSFKKIRVLNEKEAAAQNKLSGKLADSISNILSVKSNGLEKYEMQLYGRANRQAQHASRSLMRASVMRDFGFSTILCGFQVIFILVLVGGHSWFGLPIGTLVLAVTYGIQMTNQIWSFNNILHNINRGLGDAQEMTKILDEPKLVYDVKNATQIRIGQGAIDFSDITFWHTDATEKDKVFEDFSLSIPTGQRIGLVGRSGSGKTTLTKLLLRFADVQHGEILIDGQNIAEHTQESLRQQIAYVPQEPMLFHRSLRENIAYGKPDASDDEIIKAAELANAWEFIDKLPEKLDTLCGERGVKLSGGQRQRIAIARAILKDAPILVLDEATSALDSESEKLIQDALAHLMKGRTSIVIAHRLSTVAKLDRIVVLSDGKVVEDDTHENLVARDGEYAKLWNRQTGNLAE